MEALHFYIPTDRRHALANGVDLPERTQGAALFADISGFTPLTEALVRALGPQRGAEELPRQLNLIYDALIAEVDRYSGSVIGFSGDAITCWFDDTHFEFSVLSVELKEDDTQKSDDQHSTLNTQHSTLSTQHLAASRAAACALAIQQTMQQFAQVAIPGAGTVEMAIKVAVAVGAVRRFIVGDLAIQTIDVLAGETLNRLAEAEHQANRGEVVLDEPTVAALGGQLHVREWRNDHESGARFAVVDSLTTAVEPTPWPAPDPNALSDEQTRPWLLPPVYERLGSGKGEFLTELRPAAVLFLRFNGIDYDNDEAAQRKLDTFIKQVQRVMARYDGSLLQLTVGDKGSYLYAAFGAPLAHEDDAVRAVSAALELRQLNLAYITGVQIGISQGRMRTGAYGGVTRRTYGVLGDEVNMAARLMQHAPVGHVLVSLAARKSTGDLFTWEPLPPLRVKGKSQPVMVFQLIGLQEHRTIRLHEPQYARPMFGRRAELAAIERLLDEARDGRGQIVGITAEAGMGKSRLIAELIWYALLNRVVGYGGECPSYGTNTSYLVWQTIWRGLFGLDQVRRPDMMSLLEQRLASIDPALLPRLPLLGAVLGLDIPDNEVTSSLDAKLRKQSLEVLLTDCLRVLASESPLLLVLEDCHWIDPLSRDLLEVIGRAVAQLPVMIVLSYRPPQLPQLTPLPVNHLTHFSEVSLSILPPEEVEALVQSKIMQLYGSQIVVADDFVANIRARTQSNPFYIEELLNYLHDRQIDPQQPAVIQQIDLPASLHSLIMSRIDRLGEDQRTLLKVASVIGRLFQASILWGITTFFGMHERLRRDLEALTDLELTAQDSPDPELAYLFKHIVTQEVAYESLLYTTRATLHDQIGQYIERSYSNDLSGYVDLLAYHYDRSENQDKRREYLLRAGDAARADYANAVAIDYYGRVLLLLEGEAHCLVLLSLGQVFEVTGQWPEAQARYRAASELAERVGSRNVQAQAEGLIGDLLRKQGQYSEALATLVGAQATFEQLGDRAGLAQVLHFTGTLMLHQGSYATARDYFDASLVIRREQNDREAIGRLLSNLSIVAYHQGELERAWTLCHDSLAVRRETGHKLWIANSLGNLGMLALEAGRYDEAQTCMEEALVLERIVGDRSAIAISLNNLGSVARDQGNYDRSYILYRESLTIAKDLGDSWALCYLLEDIGCLSALRSYADPALRLAAAAAALRTQISAPLSPPEQANLDQKLESARHTLGAAAATVWDEGHALGLEQAITFALSIEWEGIQ